MEDNKSYSKSYLDNYKSEIFTKVIGVGEFGDKFGKDAHEYVLNEFHKDWDCLIENFEDSWFEYSCANDSASDEEIDNMLISKDLAFIISDSSTHIEASTKIASISKAKGVLTVAIVTDESREGTDKLLSVADCVIVISQNEKSIKDAISNGISTIVEPIYHMGLIAIDWYDVKASISNAGLAHLGVGNAKGKDRGEQAAKMAMSSPLVETNISDAKGIITHFICSPDIDLPYINLKEINSAIETITNEAHPDATILFHATFDTSLEDEMRITLIATEKCSSKYDDDISSILNKR